MTEPSVPTVKNKQAQLIDTRRRQYILSFVSYITGAVMLLYAIRHIGDDSLLLSGFLFISGSLFLANILYFHLSGNINRACAIESVLVAAFVLVLVYHGGHNNTALYWVFPFPAMLFGLTGVRYGVIGNAILLLILSVMLYLPEFLLATYTDAEKSRFLASLAIVVVVCWINDYFREQSHNAMSKLQQSREHQANTDPLTQLANRRFMDSEFFKAILQQPDQFLPLAVIMCDIDHFKRVNDEHGHDVGDEILKQLANIFRANLRQNDIACRSGGEEFLLFLPQTGSEQAYRVAEKIRQYLNDTPMTTSIGEYPLTVSFGVAICEQPQHLQAAIKAADGKLYQAKRTGRNKVC